VGEEYRSCSFSLCSLPVLWKWTLTNKGFRFIGCQVQAWQNCLYNQQRN
jgi:hypothetical protein